ncbi:MAG: prepilin-type N-terminal cleavage/methylation domain-containing protein [bacterium]
MKKNGFSLFELVIYLVIFSIFSLLSFGFLSEMYKKFFNQMEENKSLMRKNIVFDLLKRDLICAISKTLYWDEKSFVFRKIDVSGKITDISWQMRKDGVYRLIGQYDFINKIWFKKNVARLDFCFYDFTFSLKKDITKCLVESVHILLGNDIQFIIALRNRIKV